MLDNFFGWFVNQEKKDLENLEDNHQKQFIAKENEGGAIETDVPASQYHYDTFFGFQNQYLSQGYRVTNVAQLIDQYRTTSLVAEVDNAIDEIANQAIVINNREDSVKIDLDNTNFQEQIKNKIQDEFKEILNLYDFNRRGNKLFRKWYVDSRLYFHKILQPQYN